MTVAAQQRAEAAYRRQRMAQERAEQTVVWLAEMEVELEELEDLKERASEGRLFCEKNIKNSWNIW